MTKLILSILSFFFYAQFSSAQSRIINLPCSKPARFYQPVGLVNYSLRVFLNTSISGPYGQYFLVTKSEDINSPEHEEKLNFKEFNSGWLYLTGKTAMVQLDSRYSIAKVDFGSGLTANCRAQ